MKGRSRRMPSCGWNLSGCLLLFLPSSRHILPCTFISKSDRWCLWELNLLNHWLSVGTAVRHATVPQDSQCRLWRQLLFFSEQIGDLSSRCHSLAYMLVETKAAFWVEFGCSMTRFLEHIQDCGGGGVEWLENHLPTIARGQWPRRGGRSFDVKLVQD